MDLAAIVISVVAVSVSFWSAFRAADRDRRAADAAVTGDLYQILRTIRDAAWQYAKPVGGGADEHLVTLHFALLELRDTLPRINNARLATDSKGIFEHPASGVPLGIDPPRFNGAFMGPDYVASVAELATLADGAIQQCQAIRRGVT